MNSRIFSKKVLIITLFTLVLSTTFVAAKFWGNGGEQWTGPCELRGFDSNGEPIYYRPKANIYYVLWVPFQGENEYVRTSNCD